MSALRAADNYKQRPTAIILHSAYALHEKWWDRQWTPSLGDESWTDWDYVLAEVYQIIEDYTDKSTGQWMPYDHSGEVYWDTKSIFSGSQEAIDKEKERRDLKPGESLYAVPVFRDPDNKPTLQDWFEDMATEHGGDRRPPELASARPPTPEELAAMG